jgi:hypothetical protein
VVLYNNQRVPGGLWPASISRLRRTSLTGWSRRWRAGTAISRPLSGMGCRSPSGQVRSGGCQATW